MAAAAEAGAKPAPASDLAALSAALIVAHGWAIAHPGEMSEVYGAGYQRTIRWVMRRTKAGGWEHLIVLRREHLSPYDLDHENLALALDGVWDKWVGALAVLERRPMDENDATKGTCYRVGQKPAPEPTTEGES